GGEPGVLNQLAPDIRVGAGKPDDERYPETGLPGARDQRLGNEVAAHDAAAEYVYENRLQVAAREHHLEAVGHLLARRHRPDIHEVRGVPAMQLQDIERGQSEAGAADETADIAVEPDVIDLVAR